MQSRKMPSNSTYLSRVAGIVVAILGLGGVAAAEEDVIDELMGLDIDQLMNLEITSVSKRSERLFEAPAAVYVLTNEEIRRSGMRSVPELLRMVPGVQVAQQSGNRWAITARGFNGLFSDKLLVMIDGRSVYSPLFAGVYWDAQDVLIEDIDRIEVIRGPGATVWGANAVNGVVNIVTRRAKDSEGLYVSGGVGNVERGFAEVRYGGAVGEDVHYSAYFKWFQRSEFESRDGEPATDATDALRGGAKLEWQITDDDLLIVQGDAYGGDSNASVQMTNTTSIPPGTDTVFSQGRIVGGNVQARWEHAFAEKNAGHVQFYYDRADRDDAQLGYMRNTIDFDLQHHFDFLQHGIFTWGFAWRRNWDDSESSDTVVLDPAMRTDDLISGFLQAEWRAFDDLLRLTAGSKLERNDYTGFEYQPSGRIAIVPNDRNTVWASISRAVRTPSRSDEDVTITGLPSPAFGFQIQGNRALVSEVALAYEAGYRVRPLDRLQLDLAGFYNDFEQLLSSEPTGAFFCLYGGAVAPFPPPPSCPTGPGTPFNPVMQSIQIQNALAGSAWGIEFSGRWSVIEDWTVIERFSIDAAYGYLDVSIDTSASADPNSGLQETSSPQHQVNGRFHFDFPFGLTFDTSIYWVDELPKVTATEAGVPDYFRMDMRWGWFATENIEASVVLQNATNASHQEWVTQQGIIGTDVPRSVYGQLSFRY